MRVSNVVHNATTSVEEARAKMKKIVRLLNCPNHSNQKTGSRDSNLDAGLPLFYSPWDLSGMENGWHKLD